MCGEIWNRFPSLSVIVSASDCIFPVVNLLVASRRNHYLGDKAPQLGLSSVLLHDVNNTSRTFQNMTTLWYGNAYRIIGIYDGNRLPLDSRHIRPIKRSCHFLLSRCWNALTLIWNHCNEIWTVSVLVTLTFVRDRIIPSKSPVFYIFLLHLHQSGEHA